ncbi:hypothetical protein QQG55_22590 [Brugia pahangi]
MHHPYLDSESYVLFYRAKSITKLIGPAATKALPNTNQGIEKLEWKRIFPRLFLQAAKWYQLNSQSASQPDYLYTEYC